MCQWIEQNREKIRLWRRLIVLVLVIAALALVIGLIASKVGAFWRWPLGLVFAIVTGQIACPYFLRALRDDYMQLPKPSPGGVPPSVVGVAENLVFTVAVGASYTGQQGHEWVFTVMALWLAAKMLAGWNRDDSIVIQGKPDKRREEWFENRARGAASALLAGVLNLVIATVGGNIAAGGVVVRGGAAVFTLFAEWILGVEQGANPVRYYPPTDIAL